MTTWHASELHPSGSGASTRPCSSAAPPAPTSNCSGLPGVRGLLPHRGTIVASGDLHRFRSAPAFMAYVAWCPATLQRRLAPSRPPHQDRQPAAPHVLASRPPRSAPAGGQRSAETAPAGVPKEVWRSAGAASSGCTTSTPSGGTDRPAAGDQRRRPRARRLRLGIGQAFSPSQRSLRDESGAGGERRRG